MSAVLPWIYAIRPRTLLASFSPILVGTALAYADGYFSLQIALYTLITGIGLQIQANLVNDYFDYQKGADTASRKGPMRVMQAGLVSATQMKFAIILCAALTLLFGLTLVIPAGVFFVTLLCIALLCAFAYTAGPYPLAYIGLGDLFVFLFFGPAAVMGTYFLQTKLYSTDALLGSLGVGCLSTAILVINNIRDVEEDRMANKKTLVVRLGVRFGKIEYLSCLALAFILALFWLHSHPIAACASLVILPAIPCMRLLLQAKAPWAYNLLLGQTALLLLIYSAIVSIGFLVCLA